MADYYLLEDGSGHYELEGGSGSLLLQSSVVPGPAVVATATCASTSFSTTSLATNGTGGSGNINTTGANAILLIVDTEQPITAGYPQDSAGNTWSQIAGSPFTNPVGSGWKTYVFLAQGAITSTAHNFTVDLGGGDEATLQVVAISGVTTGTVLDGTPGTQADSGFVTSHPGAATTTSNANSIVFGWCCTNSGVADTFGYPAGWTDTCLLEASASTYHQTFLLYQIAATPGAYTAGAWTDTAFCEAFNVAFALNALSAAAGSAAITEGADTVSAAGVASTSASAAITESTDTVSASGASSTSGSASITEGRDAVSASGAAGAAGTAAITEGADTGAATGSTSTAGSAAITEGHDTVAASGATSTSGSAAITEGADTVSASGGASTAGSASITEGADSVSASGSGSGSAAGSAAIVEGADQVAAVGSAVSSIQPAGRHRKRYGVRDGDRLLVFDTKAQAAAARSALKALAAAHLPLKRLRAKATPVVPLAAQVIELPQFEAVALYQKEIEHYRRLSQANDYTSLIALHQELQRREEEEVLALLLAA